MSGFFISGLTVWCITAGLLLPSLVRFIKGPFDWQDAYRSGFFFTAVLWIFGLLRVSFAPENRSLMMGIICLSMALASYFCALTVQFKMQRGKHD